MNRRKFFELSTGIIGVKAFLMPGLIIDETFSVINKNEKLERNTKKTSFRIDYSEGIWKRYCDECGSKMYLTHSSKDNKYDFYGCVNCSWIRKEPRWEGGMTEEINGIAQDRNRIYVDDDYIENGDEWVCQD